MKCFKCEKRTGKHNINKETCGACREVLKIDLVNIVLELDPIYLSESNRNKRGRKAKLNVTQQSDIRWAHNNDGVSMGKLAKQYGVGRSTIFNIVHKK